MSLRRQHCIASWRAGLNSCCQELNLCAKILCCLTVLALCVFKYQYLL